MAFALDVVQFISRVSGQECDTQSDGMITWAGLSIDYGDGPQPGYWLYLHHTPSKDAGYGPVVSHIDLHEDYIDFKTNPYNMTLDLVYLIQGYCVYHDIPFRLNDNPYKDSEDA
jgi:hypothetical protein